MRKPRVIVCDDDEVILHVFRHALEKMGYEVLTAKTPLTCAFFRDDAESCPQHDRCTDVLITDYAMPNMTGLELLEMQHHRGCKLTSRNKALLTGRDDDEIKKRTEDLGSSFLSKPLPIAVLEEWIRECITRVDLSEPLAKELFHPANKASLRVGP